MYIYHHLIFYTQFSHKNKFMFLLKYVFELLIYMSQYMNDPNVVYPNKYTQENNPNGLFRPLTQQNNYYDHNFQRSFTSNEPMIERQNFRNQNNVLHNNLHGDIQYESVKNYTIDIDSKDREISSYLDPFKYTVIFAPPSRETIRRTEWIDPLNHSLGTRSVQTTFNPTPPPNITQQFKNIKYIRVDNVILPKYSGIAYDRDSGLWILDTTKDLSKDRYVVMKIKNIDSRYNLSTNAIVESTGIKLIPDTIPPNSNFYYAIPANAENVIKTYNISSLGNLDRMYIEFYDSMGTQLAYTNLDSTVPLTDIRNPLNVNLQNNITFVFGVVENEMATEVQFAR